MQMVGILDQLGRLLKFMTPCIMMVRKQSLQKKTLTRLAKTYTTFYMGLGYFKPHLPFTAPQKYWGFYNPEKIPLAPNPNVSKNAPNHTMNSMYELRHYDGFNNIGHPQSSFKMPEETSRKLKHG